MQLTDLAVLCGNVAEDTRMEESMRNRAHELVMEWVNIHQSKKKELNRDKKDLAVKMAQFLVTV